MTYSVPANPTNTSCHKLAALELLVLSGLNVGERLSLLDGPMVIGGSEDCDLFLVDPHVDQACCILEMTDNSISLSVIKNANASVVLGDEELSVAITDSEIVRANEKFSVNGIWMALVNAGKDLQSKPKLSSLEQKKQALDAFKKNRKQHRDRAVIQVNSAGGGCFPQTGRFFKFFNSRCFFNHACFFKLSCAFKKRSQRPDVTITVAKAGNRRHREFGDFSLDYFCRSWNR